MKKAAAVCLAIWLVCAMAGCGYLSPEAAMEGIGIGHSNQARIEIDDNCYFYYTTIADNYENPGDVGQWLYTVTPCQKSGLLGMWSATPDPGSHPVYTKATEEMVGGLVSVEYQGQYHNFFLAQVMGNDPVRLHEALPDDYETVIVAGQEIPLVMHSYFVTDQIVTEFAIGDVQLTVDR